MAFWNKKEEETTFVPVVLRVPHRYADILIELCSKNGYDHQIVLADFDTKTLEVQLPKGKLDKVLNMISGPLGSKFM